MRGFITTLSTLLLILFHTTSSADVPERVLVEWNDVAYFMRNSPARLERYDLNQRIWLSDVPLSGTPTAMAADAEGFYIAYGTDVYYFNSSFGEERFIYKTQQNVNAMFTDGDMLLLSHTMLVTGYYTTIDRRSGELIDYKAILHRGMQGNAIARSLKRVLGVNRASDPRTHFLITYDENGFIVESLESPAFRAYAIGHRLWISPDESRIVDSTGLIFSTIDLDYVGSLGTSLTSVAFGSDLIIVLREDKVHSYGPGLLPMGETTLHEPGHEIIIRGDDLIVFTHPAQENEKVTTQVLSLSSLEVPESPGPLPSDVPVSKPEAVFLSGNEVVFVDFDPGSLSVWDIEARAYSNSLALRGTPTVATYSDTLKRLYLAYADLLVTKVELSGTQLVEEAFVFLPAKIESMATAEEFLMVQDKSGYRATHRLFDESGVQTDSLDWNYRSPVFEWDPDARRLYFFNADFSPRDLYWESISEGGLFVDKGDSPYHGDIASSAPIYLFDEGSRIIMGSGQIVETKGLTLAGSIPNRIDSATWFSGSLYTSFRETDHMMVQRWSAAYQFERAVVIPGQHLALMNTESHLLAITLHADVLTFTFMDAELETIWSSMPCDRKVLVDNISSQGATLTWDGVGRDGQTAILEYFNPVIGNWQVIDSVDATVAQYHLQELVPGQGYAYRVKIGEYLEFQPSTRSFTQTSHAYLASSEDLQSFPWNLIYEEESADGNWLRMDAISTFSYRTLLRQNLAPFTKFNFRGSLEVPIEQELETPPNLTYSMEIELEVPDNNEFPILVFRYSNDQSQTYELYATLPNDQTTFSLSSTELSELPELHFYVDHPEPTADLPLYANYTFLTEVHWEPVQDVESYLVYSGYYPQVVEGTYASRLSRVHPDPGQRFELGFHAVPVKAIVGWELQPIASWNQVRSTLGGERLFFSTVQIRYRLSADSEWVVAATIARYPVDIVVDGDIVPEFREFWRSRVPETVMGNVSFATPDDDNHDPFAGSIATDTTGNRYVEWFGDYWHTPLYPDWCYSYDFGWMHPVAVDESSWWLWTSTLGWTYWQSNSPSILYIANHANWYFHWQGTSWLKDFQTGESVELL